MENKIKEFKDHLFDVWDNKIYNILCDLEIEEAEYKGIARYWSNCFEEAKAQSFHTGVFEKSNLLNIQDVLEKDIINTVSAIEEEFLNRDQN